jgi:hypothetical protein
MVEAANHCRLLPTFILDIYKVYEHLSMLSICTWGYLYTVKLAKLAQLLAIVGQLLRLSKK